MKIRASAPAARAGRAVLGADDGMRSSSSRMDISPEFSFEHMLEFSKLAVGFAIELGGWKKTSA